jgi:hypothetical protein
MLSVILPLIHLPKNPIIFCIQKWHIFSGWCIILAIKVHFIGESMPIKNQPYMEELTWEQARLDLIKVNPEIVKILDDIGPDKSHTLFKARYPYGSEILRRAEFYVPNDKGEFVTIEDPSLSSHVRERLSYNMKSNPVMVLLNGSVEMFLTLEDRTVPFGNLLSPGKIVGTFRILTTEGPSYHPAFLWDMTSGARSVFMLSKISDIEKHRKLRKEFSISIDKPKSFLNHWEIFREIANHKSFPGNWDMEMLFFSDKWFEHFQDEKWMFFNHYLYCKAWNSSDYWRNIFFWNFMLSLMQEESYLKPTPYAVSTAKHILAISTGESYGFAPAIDNLAGPLQELQSIFLNIYGINHAPVIMQPTNFNLNNENCRPVYYSLSFPNATEFWPKSRERNSFINEIFEIKNLLENYIKKIISNELRVDNTPFYEAALKVNFDFIHNDIKMDNIKTGDEILSFDPTFVMHNEYENLPFPISSSFFKGCIRISRK